ncbi:QueT transporter family protein [Camelliibacillus cellulosilyticus]|uniref:QueT transporter family protein n=1 Tax=Camelliibacillus cellulosilyticus TaxID=2174486 RepID=A0ABV9GQM1_9BACL
MKIKLFVANGILAALYIVVSFLIQPFGFTNIQFRVSEIFNHLVVFNKRYIYGIVIGVFLTNLFFSPMMAYDLVFGVGQSVISLIVTILVGKFVHNIWGRMAINTVVFTVSMGLIAAELHLALHYPFALTWLTTAVGEFVVMAVGAPIMYAINKRLTFEKLV